MIMIINYWLNLILVCNLMALNKSIILADYNTTGSGEEKRVKLLMVLRFLWMKQSQVSREKQEKA